MVARREHVGAKIEEFVGKLRRDSEAAGRVLAVDHHEVDLVRGNHMPDVLPHNPPPRAAEDVTDEKNVQIQLSAFSFQLSTGSGVRGVSSSLPALLQNSALCCA